MLLISLFVCVPLLLLVLYWFALLPPLNGLRVLMYHKVSTGPEDGLSIQPETLEKQVKSLLDLGFTPVSLTQVQDHVTKHLPLPRRCFLLTFDDGYRNNLTVAAPVLARFPVCPAVFIPTALIGKINIWDKGKEPLMTLEELNTLKQLGWEIGLHGHEHQHYGHTSPSRVQADVRAMVEFSSASPSLFEPNLAYPYGGRPKGKEADDQMYRLLGMSGILSAFRIGNRINSLPLKHRYSIERLDITGNMTDLVFRRKVKYGKPGNPFRPM